MFEPVKQARLQPHDIARLLGVNRSSASLWLNGHRQPHHLLANRVKKLVDSIRWAVEAGDLPVPHDVIRRERAHYIQTVLRNHGHIPPAS